MPERWSRETVLREAFDRADPDYFRWQTRAPYVADQERALVTSAFQPLGTRVLDLGCGQGSTLHHLGGPRVVGVDLFPSRTRFAAAAVAGPAFVAASGYELPFRDGAFDHVLVRDVIHHLAEPTGFLEECWRVLSPGGRLDVLEPTRGNPLIVLHALFRAEERGELRSSEAYLRRILDSRFRVERTGRHQPLPLHRVLLHPTMGSPELARNPLGRRLLETAERLGGRVLPERGWAYLHLRCSRRDG